MNTRRVSHALRRSLSGSVLLRLWSRGCLAPYAVSERRDRENHDEGPKEWMDSMNGKWAGTDWLQSCVRLLL